jgi:hypothetical protein
MKSFTEAYYLESTGDNTDRTAEIEKRLTEGGACLLGAGVYVVSGVKMPKGTTLRGLGAATRLVLSDKVAEGCTVYMNALCTVSDMSVLGALEPIPCPDSIGTRHGIAYIGTATEENYSGQPLHLIINNLFISSFTGGGLYCRDTGYSTSASITAANCHIYGCGVGIYIPHFSEYHEFTNMLCASNLYGCINNGGNNVFVNCGFNSNKTAFVIDNSQDQSVNNSHGSAVGCTFNHSGKNKGIGIWMRGASVGYVFTGCQVFYSEIIVENSKNITFSDINFGKDTNIRISGGELCMFSGCAFMQPPHITVADGAAPKFINCFSASGEEIKP